MNHQPYEFLLLSDEPLHPDQELDLRAHLSTCVACQQLERAWQEVQSEFAGVDYQAPAHGFVGRWQSRLAGERARSERRQGVAVLLFSAAGTAILLALMVSQWLLAYQTPAQFFLAVGALLASVFSMLNASVEILTTMVRALPGVFLLTAWAAFAGLGWLSTIWIVSIHQITFKRRVFA